MNTLPKILLGILAWVALAAMWAAPAKGAEPATPDPQTPTPIIGTASSADGARVNLYAAPGPCTGRARLAEHIAPGGTKTIGCWLMTTAAVLIAFLDGERGDIPMHHMRWAREI